MVLLIRDIPGCPDGHAERTRARDDRDAGDGSRGNSLHFACGLVWIGGAFREKLPLVISNDTGPLHLARAAGAPTIGIFWAPNALKLGPAHPQPSSLGKKLATGMSPLWNYTGFTLAVSAHDGGLRPRLLVC